MVRYEGEQPEQMETIRQTMIDTPSGARVPLSAVPLSAIAQIREDRSPNFPRPSPLTRASPAENVSHPRQIVSGEYVLRFRASSRELPVSHAK